MIGAAEGTTTGTVDAMTGTEGATTAIVGDGHSHAGGGAVHAQAERNTFATGLKGSHKVHFCASSLTVLSTASVQLS
jgi:hypothetical protein